MCREPGCRRTAARPGLAYCEQHRRPWKALDTRPEWLKRSLARDLTGAIR